jgi:hypothetical protein
MQGRAGIFPPLLASALDVLSGFLLGLVGIIHCSLGNGNKEKLLLQRFSAA